MKNSYFKVLFSGLLLLCGSRAHAQLVTDNVFLQGAYLEIGISPNGSFGNSVTVPVGYTTSTGSYPSYTDPILGTTATGNGIAMYYDYGHDGWDVGSPAFFGDYVMPGTPFEGWSVQLSGESRNDAFYNNGGFRPTSGGTLTGTNISYSSGGGQVSGVWQGTFGTSSLPTAISITQTTVVDTFGSSAVVTTVFKNTSTTDMTGLYYLRTCDPDNDETHSSSFTTNNTIVYSGDYYNREMVSATGTSYSEAYLALGTKDCRAKPFIYNSWPPGTSLSLSGMYDGSNSGYYYSGEHTGDIAIGLVYNLGDLPAGDSTVISYAYIFDGDLGIDSAFPEPQLVVDGGLRDSVDTENACTSASTTMDVNIIHGSDKNWTWGHWQWAPTTGLASDTGVNNTIDFSALTGITTYTITGTDSAMGTCEAKTFYLTIIPPLTHYTVSNNGPVCYGGELHLYATDTFSSGTTTFLWTGPGGFVSTEQDPIAPAVYAPLDSGVYTLVATHNGCISVPYYDTVLVRDSIARPRATDPTYCQFLPSVALTATAPDGIVWYTSIGGAGSTTAPTPSTTGAGVTRYYVNDSIYGCYSAYTTVTVTVNPKPAPPVITNDPGFYCQGADFVPFTAAGSNITWYTTATGGTGATTPPAINTSITGTDTVYATQTVLGCISDRSSDTVVIYKGVYAKDTAFVRLGCTADTAFFLNNSYGEGISAATYYWKFGDLSSPSSEPDPTHVYTYQDNFTATLYVTGATGCKDSANITLNLVHPIAASFTYNTAPLCQGGSVPFTNTSVALQPGYVWSFGDGSTSTAANPSHTYPNTGVYNVFLALADTVPCHDTAYGTITVDSAGPIALTVSDTNICAGTYVTISSQYISNGLTGSSFAFSDGTDSIVNTNPVTHAFPNPGAYTVTANAYYRSCPGLSVTRSINVFTQPAIDLGPDTSVCQGSAPVVLADLVNGGNDAASWMWNDGSAGSSITVTSPGYYYATVSLNGCTASDTVLVTSLCYIDLPRAFTPDGDGTNDYFNPREFMRKGLSSFTMNIYDRWGQQVFTTSSVDGRGWDGKFNSTAQPEGVYIYIIDATFTDGHNEHRQGNITLLR